MRTTRPTPAAAIRSVIGRRTTTAGMATSAAADSTGQIWNWPKSDAIVGSSSPRLIPSPEQAQPPQSCRASRRHSQEGEPNPPGDQRCGRGDDDAGQVAGRVAGVVGRDPAADDQKQTERGGQFGGDQSLHRAAEREHRGDRPGQHQQAAEHDREVRSGDAAEPTGRIRPEDVERQESERHDDERLGSGAQPLRGQPGAQATGGGGQADEYGGPASHAHLRPGDGEEDQGRHQQAERSEAEENLRNRGGAHRPRGPRWPWWRRPGQASGRGNGRGVGGQRLPQLVDQLVGPDQGGEEELRRLPSQTEVAVGARWGAVLDVVAAARAGGWVGVAVHASIKPRRRRSGAVPANSDVSEYAMPTPVFTGDG